MTTIGKPTYEELEKKCALQQSKLAAINELMSVVEKASDIAKAGIEELQSQNADLAVQLANAESKCRELAAENVVKHEFIKTCFRASADGASMDGDDIQKLGERLGLFGRETYQPVLHGYICGHEAGEDTVYVMKKTPVIDTFLAEVRAQGAEEFLKFCGEENSVFVEAKAYYRSLSDAVDEFAAQLRKGAAL